jgi:hypothetical protein
VAVPRVFAVPVLVNSSAVYSRPSLTAAGCAPRIT